MSFYVIGPREELSTESASFRVAGTVATRGLAIDRSLVPEYPGIQGARDIAAWDPPFPVDLGLVRPQDERYWDDFGATPKAFVAQNTGRRLWSTRYGSITSVRIAPPAEATLSAFEPDFRRALLHQIDPRQLGFAFQEIKEDGLRAATGATDFGGLFLLFSGFLIISSVLLAGLLFGLSVERRASEIGLLFSVGTPLARVRRQLLAEGGLLALVGATLGIAGGIGYAWCLLSALRTLWLPAVGSPLLFLHLRPASLMTGWAISVLIVLASIAWRVRRLGRIPTVALLAGNARDTSHGGRRSVTRLLLVAALGALSAIGLIVYAMVNDEIASPGLAFGSGASLLVAGLALLATWCKGDHGGLPRPGWPALAGMAARNSAWSPGRSILSAALVACATFVIFTVASNYRDPRSEAGATEAGGGGYALMATSEVPLHVDLNAEASRFELGFPSTAEETLAGMRVTGFRLLPGDDASCLNLYRPGKPRILGVPSSQIARGGFEFTAALGERDNPWHLLEEELEPGVIPAIGDANSVQWILHLGLGQELEIDNEFGDRVRLRIVALLRDSIFQSELLISEGALLRNFPSQSGTSYFLIDVQHSEATNTGQILEETLAPYGFDATPTAERLAGFLVVQNTYLSTFQMLGGLGLLLGTLGLGIVLVRNVIERRGELATLRAFGFRGSWLALMVLAENAFLLLAGTVIGSASALVAVAPRLLGGGLSLPWASLMLTLASVLLVGMLASSVAVLGALRVPLLPDLKAETT